MASKPGSAVATTLDTQDTYSSDGTDIIATLGPEHPIALDDGTVVLAREHTSNSYGVTSTFGEDLLTQTVDAAIEPGSTTDVQARTTTYQYSGQSGIGLSLGVPTSTTVDPGGLGLVTTTTYDSAGNVIGTISPGNTSGGDAHEIDITYYRAGTGSGVAGCDSKPQFAGMLCETGVAAQPGGSLPAIPTDTYTYNMYGSLLTKAETSGSTTRTTTYTYDAANRLASGSATGLGTAMPTVTFAYSPSTGLVSSASDGTRSITTSYDALGRVKTYTDAAGNVSSYTYDDRDRPISLDDGKGAQTYTYESTSDERGLLTKVVDSAAGTFSGIYDADGNLIDQTLPNGLHECTTYDAVDVGTDRRYESGGNCAASGTAVSVDFTAQPSIHGQWISSSGPTSTGGASSAAYTYDSAGRLTQAADTRDDGCTTRTYSYNADGDRLASATYAPGSGGSCQTATSSASASHSYDAADRLTDTGVTYDAMGDVTALPSSDTAGGAESFSYYADGQANTASTASITHTATLGPDDHLLTWSTSADPSATQTDHYSGGGDSPVWISENTANTVWTRNVAGVDRDLDAVEASTGSVTYYLSDLHGDVAAEADSGGSLTSTADYDEFGNPDGTSGRYGWLGAQVRFTDSDSGVVLMGARLYSPVLGRFLQDDPARASADPYDYAGDDPVNAFDPAGMKIRYVWSESRTVNYGTCGADWGSIDCNVIGSMVQGASVNLNGRQAQLAMLLDTLDGPEIHPTFTYNCTGTAKCGGSHTEHFSGYGVRFSYEVGYPGHNPTGGPHFPDGSFDITFKFAYTVENSGVIGWVNPIYTSPTITCNRYTLRQAKCWMNY